MRKLGNRSLIPAVLALAAACALAAFLMDARRAQGSVARVYIGGELVHEIDLGAVTEPYALDIGGRNTLWVEKGAVGMQSADCPDQLCVRQGTIRPGDPPIVCLPNRVVVTIESGADDIDAVSGR